MIGRKLALLSLNPVQTLLVSRAQPKIWQKIPQNWRTSVFWMFNCMWGCNGVRWMILSLSGYDCLKCMSPDIWDMYLLQHALQIRKSHQRENRLWPTLESSPDYLYYFLYRDLEQKLLIGELSEFCMLFSLPFLRSLIWNLMSSVYCSKSLTDSECVGCQGSIICIWREAPWNFLQKH